MKWSEILDLGLIGSKTRVPLTLQPCRPSWVNRCTCDFFRKHSFYNAASSILMIRFSSKLLQLFPLTVHIKVVSWNFEKWRLNKLKERFKWPMGKWEIANILQSANRISKWREIWDSGILVLFIWRNFDYVMFMGIFIRFFIQLFLLDFCETSAKFFICVPWVSPQKSYFLEFWTLKWNKKPRGLALRLTIWKTMTT